MTTPTIIELVLLAVLLLKQFSPQLRKTLSSKQKEDDIDWIDVIIIIIIIIIIIFWPGKLY